MEERRNIHEYAAVWRRRHKLASAAALAVFAASVAVALVLPPQFRSSATILIEQQEIPQDLVRSTITSFADQRIQLIFQRVMTSANLLAIIEKYDLYLEERQRDTIEVVVERMRTEIDMQMLSADVVDPRNGKPTKATIAFTLSFRSGSAQLAQKVANELTSLYLNENTKSRTQVATDTARFLGQEAERLGESVSEFESRLATFKKTNAGSLPEMLEVNIQLLDRTERELLEVERQVRASEQNRIYLESQIALLEPHLAQPVIRGADGQVVASPAQQLSVLNSQYVSLSSVYAREHPDVVRIRREIQALSGLVGEQPSVVATSDLLAAAQAELTTAEQKYSQAHPDVQRLTRKVERLRVQLVQTNAHPTVDGDAPDNPAYVQTRAQLSAATTDLASTRIKAEQLREKLTVLEGRITASPLVEQDYREVMRDYENALTKYQDIRARQMEARLGQALETERKGERFTLIEPPLLPEEPSEPNRLGLMLVGFILSLGFGAGTAAVSEALDSSVRDARDIETVTGAPPLACIPVIDSPARSLRRLGVRLLWVVLLFLAVAATAYAVHRWVMPLDVAFYTTWRRLGF